MAKTSVGNDTTTTTAAATAQADALDSLGMGTGDAEFDALFEEIAEEFGESPEALGDEYDELNAAIAGTDLDVPAPETADMSRLYEIADGTLTESGTETPELFDFIKRRFRKRAEQAARALIRKVKSAARYAKCIPAVLKVVAAVKAGKWGTAIREALAAWRCIRKA